jgi:hypothetical protein
VRLIFYGHLIGFGFQIRLVFFVVIYGHLYGFDFLDIIIFRGGKTQDYFSPAATLKNITNAFSKTGIYPVNEKAPLTNKFIIKDAFGFKISKKRFKKN